MLNNIYLFQFSNLLSKLGEITASHGSTFFSFKENTILQIFVCWKFHQENRLCFEMIVKTLEKVHNEVDAFSLNCEHCFRFDEKDTLARRITFVETSSVSEVPTVKRVSR